MKKIVLNLDALAVSSFPTVAPQAPAAVDAGGPTDSTCQPYFCLRWPTV